MPTPPDPKAVMSSVPVRDFGGLKSYVDPHDIDPGVGRVQVNAISTRPGELRTRDGYRRLKFDD